MRWSLRLQFLVPLLALLLGVVVMSVWAAVASANHARDQINTQVQQIVFSLNEASFPLTERVLQLLKGFSGADYLVIEKNGQRVATIDHPLPPFSEPDRSAKEWQNIRLEQHVKIKERGYLYTGVMLEKGPNSGSALYIFYPESRWQEAMWHAVRPTLIFGAAGGLAAVLLMTLLIQRLLRRVRQLEKQTRLIAEGDFSPMPLPPRNDELRDLTNSVNTMAARLSALQDSMRNSERLRLLGQVGGGLAHQLRNGVAGARLAVQVHAREHPGEADDEALQVALRQLSLVEMHLKRFLALGGNGESERVSCCLSGLLRDSISLLRPQCRHAHVELRDLLPETDADYNISGNPDELGQLFLNLLINAVEAAGPPTLPLNGGRVRVGGWVEVELSRSTENLARVRISDSGPGPPAELAEQLFEPFVTGKREGIGLGLAVARETACGHGGKVWWERNGGRTTFYVELPLEKTE